MNNTTFKMKLVQTVFDVCCTCPTTMGFCRDYLVPGETQADIRIDITAADIQAERDYLTGKNGEQLNASTPEALEILVLCRKIAERFVSCGCVLFHGSALAIDDSGVIFTAVSGTGKSTHTGLWRKVFGSRVTMINDDKPFLQIGSDGVRVWGSPWRGKHRIGENTSAPLKAICILNRGTENRIERISPREALPVLLQQTYQPRNPAAMLSTLKLVDRMSANVAVYRLFCNMDEEAAVVAFRGIAGGHEESGRK